MPEAGHIHERGELWKEFRNPGEPPMFYKCSSCDWHAQLSWWDGYAAMAIHVQKHGLPDHDERVEEALNELYFEGDQSEGERIIIDGIAAYLTWTKEGEKP